MSENLLPLIRRWDDFLARIRTRADAVLDEAREGCLALFHQHDGEPTAMSNALPAVRQRLLDLAEKADAAWLHQVSAAFDAAGASPQQVAREFAKARALRDGLDAAFEEFEVRLHADASRMMWARLAPRLPRQIFCTQCGTPLPLPLLFCASNLSCPSCTAVVTYEPGDGRIAQAYIIPKLAHEAAWEVHTGAETLPRPPELVAHADFGRELAQWQRRLSPP